MKHFYLLLVAIAAALTANATEFTWDNFRCVVNDDGNTVTIYQNTENPPSGEVWISERMWDYSDGYRDYTVTAIGIDAFWNNANITRVEIPSTVTTIGSNAFQGCSALESIMLPNSLTSIGDIAFNGCSSLKNITLPSSINNIGRFAFHSCTALEAIQSNADPSQVTLGPNAFYKVPVTTCELRVPSEYYDAYCAADQWKNFDHIIAMQTGGPVTGDELPTVGEIGEEWDLVCMCLVSGSHKWQFADCTDNNGSFTFTIYNEGEFTPKKTFTINTGNSSARVLDYFEMYPVADYEVIATQTFFNDDEKYEVIISFNNGSRNYTHKVYNEDGEYLLTLPFTDDGGKMLVLGQNRYLMARESDDSRKRKVYHVHTSSLPVVDNRQPGDVNGDNVVSGADVTKLYDILLNE